MTCAITNTLALLWHCQSGQTPSPGCGDHAAYLDPQRSDLPGLWGQWQVDAREQTDSITHLKHLLQLVLGLEEMVQSSSRSALWLQSWLWERQIWHRQQSSTTALRMHLGSNAGWGWGGRGVNQDPLLLCGKILHCLYQGHTPHDYCQPMMGYKTLKEVCSWEMWGHWQAALAWLSSCIAGWCSSACILPFIPLLLHSDSSPASSDLTPFSHRCFLDSKARLSMHLAEPRSHFFSDRIHLHHISDTWSDPTKTHFPTCWGQENLHINWKEY